MLRSLIQETRQSAAKQERPNYMPRSLNHEFRWKARGYDWILVDNIGQLFKFREKVVTPLINKVRQNFIPLHNNN